MPHCLDRFGDYLLAKALESEQKRASLHARNINLPFGRMAYFTSRPDVSTYPEAVILLHGASADKTTWLRFARDLQCQAPLIIPDLPGHGQSTDSVDLDNSIAAQVKYVTKFCARFPSPVLTSLAIRWAAQLHWAWLQLPRNR